MLLTRLEWFAVGITLAMACILATQLLPDKHPASKVSTMKWYQRLYKTYPGPLDTMYGIPFGILMHPLWIPIVLVGGIAAGYEYFYYFKRGLTPGYEVEDIRDPLIGVLIGWLATILIK